MWSVFAKRFIETCCNPLCLDARDSGIAVGEHQIFAGIHAARANGAIRWPGLIACSERLQRVGVGFEGMPCC